MEALAAIGVAVALYAAFVGVLVLLGRREEARAWAALVPHALILTKRLLRDPRVSGLDKALLWLLLAYIVSPIDIVPDFIPVAGVLDDAVLVALVLRVVLRHAGGGLIAEHWPGPERSLRLMLRLAGARGRPA
jgi:uncharacterized membrane protein YkvA (DUF1232 family)